MKRFLTHVVLFTLPLVVFAYFLDYYISKNMYRLGDLYQDVQETQKIYDGAINSDILIVGSSRAEFFLESDWIENETQLSTYNIGSSGSNWHDIKFKLEEYLKYNKKPKYLVFNVDVHTFKHDDINKQKHRKRYDYLPYTLYNLEFSRIYDLNLFDIYLPLVRYAGEHKLMKQVLNLTFKNQVQKNDKIKGFLAVNRPWNGQDQLKKIERIDLKEMSYFQDFKYFMDQNFKESKVICVSAPYFIAYERKLENYDTFLKYTKNQLEEKNITYIDLSRLEMRFDKSYFYNNLHTNGKGARLYTTIFTNILKENI